MDDELDAEPSREELQRLVIYYASKLMANMGSAGFRLRIPLQKPELYICVGTKEDIKKLLE